MRYICNDMFFQVESHLTVLSFVMSPDTKSEMIDPKLGFGNIFLIHEFSS